MAQDLALTLDAGGGYDLVIDGDQFGVVDGFETAVTKSLFTDGRAPASRNPIPQRRRGWPGNVINPQAVADSLLWTYAQARITDEIRRRIELDAEAALSWMIESGAARSVEATAVQYNSKTIQITVQITQNNGNIQQFARLWSLTNAADISDA
jgi:phage gp46-like protein